MKKIHICIHQKVFCRSLTGDFLARFTIGMVGVAINTFPVYMCARQTILCENMNEEEKYNICISHSLGYVLLKNIKCTTYL